MASEVQRIAQILGGDMVEAKEILDEAYDVCRWREHPYQNPFRLATLLAMHHVQQRSKVGLLRRWRNVSS